ncbi:MAG: alginate export family protein [Ignavibacteriae bacterium]|nr:alginate export family protein [Ignavibacteriota bacterium]MCB9215769.1 alginate export family protein [Ignavibacteria bacterium]
MNGIEPYQKIRRGYALVLILMICSVVELAAQNPTDSSPQERLVKVGGEVRYRYEVDGRRVAEKGNDKFSDLHLLRTRANITVTPSSDLQGTIVLQDSRAFGDEQNTLDGSADFLDIHQAFFLLPDFLNTGVDVQVGRQEFGYANERLVGAVGWSNVGRSFDAIRLKRGEKWGSIDLFASRLGSSVSFDSLNLLNDFSSTNFYGLWSTVKFADNHKGDFFALFDNNTREIAQGIDSGSSIQNRITAGTFLRGTLSPINYEAEFAWQGGSGRAGSDTLSSYAGIMIAGKVLYAQKSFKVGGLYTMLSGDDDPTDDQLQTFNTLFATNHKFYGYMDFFPGNSGSAGLQDIGLTSWLKVSDNASIALDGHLFTTAVDVAGENALGKEIDATFNYAYKTEGNPSLVTFTLGASLFLADNLMKGVVGGDTGWWGYLMVRAGL